MNELINKIQSQLDSNHYVEKKDIQALIDYIDCKTLANTVRLLCNSAFETNHYAKQIDIILKRKNEEEKNTVNVKKNKKEKSYQKRN